MGQRLNIEIVANRKVLANCYYHWSGYSTTSLELTKEIIKYLSENEVSIDIKGAIEILKHTGASFSENSWIEAKKINVVEGEYHGCKGRNDGLIAVDEKNMKETRSWEEGRIEIDIKNKTFNFKCALEKDYVEQEDIWKRISDMFYEIKEMESNAWAIPFNKIDNLIEGIKKAEEEYNGRFYFGYSCFNSIY